MRIVALRGESAPNFDAVRMEFPPGLVAVLGADGRLRGAAHRMLAGVEEGVRVSTLPRVPDPVLTRLPVELRQALQAGIGVDGPEEVVEAGTRALALLGGLDRLEAARVRLVRLRGAPAVAPGPQAEALMDRIRGLEGAPEELEALEAELRTLRGDDAEITGDVEAATMEWLRERQDAETQLGAYRDRARELKERLGELEASGKDAVCPTCHRPLMEHFSPVLETLREEWETVVQDGSWWRRRREQLELKPDPLTELESRALRLHAATETLAERVELARSRVRELDEARLKLAERVGSGVADLEAVEPQRRVPDEVWAAVDEALARAARQMRGQARDELLDRTSRVLARITGGRILSASWLEAGRLDLFGVEGSLHPPAEEDAAAAQVAARVAVAQTLAARAGTPFPPLILAEPFDRMDDAVKIRTVDLLRGIVGPVFEQILLVTRGEVVDFYPEAFDTIVELRRDALAGPSVFRTVPAGLGPLSLT
ncbi:MAG TPA: hypothetical protein VLA43_19095 [Longimicrobiales bacterium]|nr:hypothetical protein [Longimicrobiales bacterium]